MEDSLLKIAGAIMVGMGAIGGAVGGERCLGRRGVVRVGESPERLLRERVLSVGYVWCERGLRVV